jgi:hypothetical protein
MSYQHLTQTLAESFSALADEVQSLTDRKTILEHKLRYAHEQVKFLLRTLGCWPLVATRRTRVSPFMMNTLALDQEPLLS